MTFKFKTPTRRHKMFNRNTGKHRSAKAGDILVFSLNDHTFRIREKNPHLTGKTSLRPDDDKIFFELKGNERQISNAVFDVAKLFAAAVCCDTIPFKMPDEQKELGFELVPFK
jgi:hypothetical protein